MKNKIHELYALEQLSGGNTCIHRLHPLIKLLATTVFIVTVVSFDRYALGRLIPYIFYPVLMASLSDTPNSMLFKRFLIALPFCLFAGISNVIFNRNEAFAIGGISISYGVISLAVILFRTWLCVTAVLLLISVTRLSDLTGEMRRLRIPGVIITMLELTYRYIGVLLNEAYSMNTAYSLRSPGKRGIEMRDMGVFTGQLLIRSIDRADRVYNAMKCRGYAGVASNTWQNNRKPVLNDIVFLVIVCLLCITFRIVDVNSLFTVIIKRLF